MSETEEPVGSLRTVDEEDLENWQHIHRRDVSPAQWAQFEKNIAEILEAFGMHLNTPGTARTPARFLKALYDATEGYEGDEKAVTAFPTECYGGPDCEISQVVEGPIPYHSLCEHHAFPFFGHAYVGYVAHERIIGISKLTRLVRLFARRFTVQERMGREIVTTLERVMEAHGVAVYIEGTHLCTQMRGVREVESRTRTTFWRGVYADNPQMRSEFMAICEARQT